MTQIMIYGEVGDCCASPHALDAASIVAMLGASNGPIEVRISSGGGNVVQGLAIYNALKRASGDGRRVTVYIDSLAASMAAVIAMAGDDIFIADNALMMIHNPWDFIIGDANDMRAHADLLDMLGNQCIGIYAARSGMDPDALKAMLAAEREIWMDSERALQMGFVTGVLQAFSAAACVDVSKFGYRKVPVHPLVTASAAASIPPAAAAVIPQKEKPMDPVVTPAAPGIDAPVTSPVTIENVQSRIDAAVAAETSRITTIRALATQHGIDDAVATAMITNKTTVEAARAQVLDILAARGDSAGVGHQPAVVTRDGRDKWLQGAMNNILMRSGAASEVRAAAAKAGVTVDLDPGEFRGVTMVQLATEALAMSGQRPTSRDPNVIIGQALTARGSGAGISNGTGDFSVLLENTLNKTLQAAYAVQPDTWSRFCGTGSVTDFRPHRRYMLGSFGALDSLNEQGELRNRQIPDGGRESITATTKGNIIGLTRQALVSDDLGAFVSLAQQLGRAAKLSVEIDVYALMVANPLMNDGVALFAAGHTNLGTAAAPTVASFDEARVLMALQRDISGNEVLDLRPAYWVGPIGLGGVARVINGSQYDPTAGAGQSRPNIALGIFQDIVDTPRLTGTMWYAFADKDIAPAIEVAFLNGVSEPMLENKDGWRFDGTEWKVLFDYGVGAVNWRSGVRNAGA